MLMKASYTHLFGVDPKGANPGMSRSFRLGVLLVAIGTLAIVLDGCGGMGTAASHDAKGTQPYLLRVIKSGNGTISSSPAGISCGNTCSASFAVGTTVTLTATAADGSIFSGWSGACSGNGSCSVTVNADASVATTFAPAPGGASAASVLTFKYDLTRAGLNPNETTLTPSNVSSNFGKLFADSVDGLVFAQPLYMPNLSIPNKGTHNVTFIATEHDSVYALDADSAQSPLWHVSFLDPAAGITSVPTTLANTPGGRTGLGPEVGITGTPVIDPSTNTLFVSAMTYEKNQAVQRLHALDIFTGVEKFGGPKVITATVSGSGVGNDGAGHITFYPITQNQRAGLLLVNGVVYVAFGSFSDIEPYHGWLFAYHAQTLRQLDVFITSPTGEGASLWQGAAAPAADSLGNIYLTTADGTFDANNGGPNYGDTLLKLKLANGSFTILDWFTPFNQNCLNTDDLDLGAGGPTLLPDGMFTHQLLIVPSKEGRVYVVDRNSMGHYRTDSDSQIIDWVLINSIACETSGGLSPDGPTTNRIYGSISYFNESAYVGPANTTLKRYTIADDGSLTLASHTTNSFQTRGATSVISANGTSNAILWVAEFATDTHQTILRAYLAMDLSDQLYASTSTADSIGRGVVFTVPVVVNGKVYVGGEGRVTVFGLK